MTTKHAQFALITLCNCRQSAALPHMDLPLYRAAYAMPTFMGPLTLKLANLRVQLVPLMAPLLRKPQHQLIGRQRNVFALKTFTVLVPYAQHALLALPRMLVQVRRPDARVQRTPTGIREMETTPVLANLALQVLLLFATKLMETGLLSLTKMAKL